MAAPTLKTRLNPYRLLIDMRRFAPAVEASYQRYRSRVVAETYWPASWALAVMLVAFHPWHARALPTDVEPLLLLTIRVCGVALMLATGFAASRVFESRWCVKLAGVSVVCGAVGLICAQALAGGPTLDGAMGLALYMVVTAMLLAGLGIAGIVHGSLTVFAWLAFSALSPVDRPILPLIVGLALTLVTVFVASMFVEYLMRTNFRIMREQQAYAQIDSLTQLANRRAVDQLGEIMVSEALEAGKPISVFLIDIDHFKRINDTWGHECGDETLRNLAATLRGFFRASDLVARWGGEEFLVILPDTPIALAERLAQRLLRRVRELNWVYRSNPIQVTISIGVTQASLRPHPEYGPATLKSLINEADRALYYSKKNGRDQSAKFSDVADLQQSGFFERRGVSPLASQPPQVETV